VRGWAGGVGGGIFGRGTSPGASARGGSLTAIALPPVALSATGSPFEPVTALCGFSRPSARRSPHAFAAQGGTRPDAPRSQPVPSPAASGRSGSPHRRGARAKAIPSMSARSRGGRPAPPPRSNPRSSIPRRPQEKRRVHANLWRLSKRAEREPEDLPPAQHHRLRHPHRDDDRDPSHSRYVRSGTRKAGGLP